MDERSETSSVQGMRSGRFVIQPNLRSVYHFLADGDARWIARIDSENADLGILQLLSSVSVNESGSLRPG